MIPGNLFEHIQGALNEEMIEVIASGKGDFKIERIVSRGHESPSDFWYDQETIEWVLLLKGSATMLFEGPEETVALEPGDWIEIAAHRRHRVDGTTKDEDTVWLAVHWK